MTVTLSPVESKWLHEQSAKLGISVSEYLRRVLDAQRGRGDAA